MAPDTPGPEPAARVLAEQLALVWMFADQHVLSQIDAELVEWNPQQTPSESTTGAPCGSPQALPDPIRDPSVCRCRLIPDLVRGQQPPLRVRTAA